MSIPHDDDCDLCLGTLYPETTKIHLCRPHWDLMVSMRRSLGNVLESLEAFADFYQRCYMSPTTLKELKTGNEADFINMIDERIREARTLLDATERA